MRRVSQPCWGCAGAAAAGAVAPGGAGRWDCGLAGGCLGPFVSVTTRQVWGPRVVPAYPGPIPHAHAIHRTNHIRMCSSAWLCGSQECNLNVNTVSLEEGVAGGAGSSPESNSSSHQNSCFQMTELIPRTDWLAAKVSSCCLAALPQVPHGAVLVMQHFSLRSWWVMCTPGCMRNGPPEPQRRLRLLLLHHSEQRGCAAGLCQWGRQPWLPPWGLS